MLNQLARYVPVADLVEETEGRSLLDIGSGSQGIERFVSTRWEITAGDVDFTDYGTSAESRQGRATRVRADARDLPFEDGSFDVVVAIDVLEHIRPEDRVRALRELARVARRRLCVACPAGAAAYEADRRLASFYARRGEPAPPWLKEHLDHGFPDRSVFESALRSAGDLRLLGNESVRAHERVLHVEAMRGVNSAALGLARLLERAVRGNRAARRASRLLLELLRGHDRAPTYRTIAVVDRDRT